ncbi:tetratricopeptide repeat protein [Spirosoma taeanense]|uniref:Tetratricopeptide repeat protein n=1 Tax=Spirosoma taeanense TaxID=2735870 RepID=A0A6M5YFI9_9BACT|nr:tetratricopeptide repeat protein [Spirosoma taeanense]QJW92031.1 tetratricopeptide repeat protein [Spirosoma taeanense]
MEILVTAAIIGYIIYLRYYADLRNTSEQDLEKLQVGIKLYNSGQFSDALVFFTQYLQKEPKSSVAYLYQARCYRALGQLPTAIEALKTGESYDDTVADLHLEMGQILYDQQAYAEAFLEFDKAVFYSKGSQADAFEWRGLTRQKLQQLLEAEQDLERALTLRQSEVAGKSASGRASDTFFDRKLLSHAIVILVNSGLLLLVIKKAGVIHLPYLLAAIAAAVIGFLEPKKGWVLAILQAATLWIGYTFFTEAPQNSGTRELELFGLYGSIILTFIGSFIGGILKRQLAH